jgi:hypothetical protein
MRCIAAGFRSIILPSNAHSLEVVFVVLSVVMQRDDGEEVCTL